MPSFHRKMGCINKRERGVRLWSLIGRCVKHFGAQVTDMIEFGSSAIVCLLPARRQESALMCISELQACARSVRSSLDLRAHNHCLLCILKEKKQCIYRCMQHSKLAEWGNREQTFVLGRSDCNFELKCRLDHGPSFLFSQTSCSKVQLDCRPGDGTLCFSLRFILFPSLESLLEHFYS